MLTSHVTWTEWFVKESRQVDAHLEYYYKHENGIILTENFISLYFYGNLFNIRSNKFIFCHLF